MLRRHSAVRQNLIIQHLHMQENGLGRWDIIHRWGQNCLVDKGIGISNDPALCGKELNESYCGTENDVIISWRWAGELMCEVVPYIDFAGIAQAKPKWYMGFSDNTNFTFLSATIADTAAV